jgi:ribosomal protein S18 acetylase RimI-like enzyme
VTAVVRAAGGGDVEAVLAVWAAARSHTAVSTDRVADIERLLEHAPGSLLVAEVDGVVAGAVVAGFDGWRGMLHRLAVLPGHRRRGVATALVRAGHEHIRALGGTRVTALVGDDDEPALAFWAAAGYGRDVHIARLVRDL